MPVGYVGRHSARQRARDSDTWAMWWKTGVSRARGRRGAPPRASWPPPKGAPSAREDVDLTKRQLADAMARATKAIDQVKEAKKKAAQGPALSRRRMPMCAVPGPRSSVSGADLVRPSPRSQLRAPHAQRPTPSA